MDIEKIIKNIEKVHVKTEDYCSKKSLDECNTSECILNRECKEDCVRNLLIYIYLKLKGVLNGCRKN